MTKAQTFRHIESLLGDYMAFPLPTQAAICALWAIGTWGYQDFDAFPYFVITAATKQSGKTRLAELLGLVSYNAKNTGALTPAVLFRSMDASANSGVTLFFDEAEQLSSEAASTMRVVLNMGYRRGQTVQRMEGDTIKEFQVYCPKAFVLIGDVYDTLRDRSILIELHRGTPRKRFQFRDVEAIAEGIREAMKAHREAGILGADGVIVDPSEWLDGRDAECWAPILTLAQEWCPDRYDEIMRASVDFTALKTAPARRFSSLAQAEEDRTEQQYGERAIRDIASIMHAANAARMFGEDICHAMCAIATAPWRSYRGEAITPVRLAHLVSRFGLSPKYIKAGGKVRRGYQRADVTKAVAKLERGRG